MEQPDREVRQNIACLRQCSAMIRRIPPLWPLWWAVLCVCEVEAARLERTLARQPRVLDAELIDFDEWRRRKAEALVRRRQSPGGPA